MSYYYRSWRRYSRPFYRLLFLFIVSIFIGIIWSIVSTLFFENTNDNNRIDENNVRTRKLPLIFCFVLSANDRHLTSARAIVYSWGKRCDRFYFVTRLQNTSVDLMMLQNFENITDITPTTINDHTVNVLAYLQDKQLFSSYHWFLRASDDSFVIMPNLRRLINQLHRQENTRPLVYVGDVEEMYEKYQIRTSGSVMLFNRNALDRLVIVDESENDANHSDLDKQPCLTKITYDHEFVTCLKQIGMNINPVNNNLILSQNLSFYKMDKRFKVR